MSDTLTPPVDPTIQPAAGIGIPQVPQQLPPPQDTTLGDNWARNLVLLGGNMARAQNQRFGAGFLQNTGSSWLPIALADTVGQNSALDTAGANQQNTLAEAETKRVQNAYNQQAMKIMALNGGMQMPTGDGSLPDNTIVGSKAGGDGYGAETTSGTQGNLPISTPKGKPLYVPDDRMLAITTNSSKGLSALGLNPAQQAIVAKTMAYGVAPTESNSNADPTLKNPDTGAFGLFGILPTTAQSPGYGMQGADADTLRQSPQAQSDFATQYFVRRAMAPQAQGGLGMRPQDFENPGLVAHALAVYNGATTPEKQKKYVHSVTVNMLARQGQPNAQVDPNAEIEQQMALAYQKQQVQAQQANATQAQQVPQPQGAGGGQPPPPASGSPPPPNGAPAPGFANDGTPLPTGSWDASPVTAQPPSNGTGTPPTPSSGSATPPPPQATVAPPQGAGTGNPSPMNHPGAGTPPPASNPAQSAPPVPRSQGNPTPSGIPTQALAGGSSAPAPAPSAVPPAATPAATVAPQPAAAPPPSDDVPPPQTPQALPASAIDTTQLPAGVQVRVDAQLKLANQYFRQAQSLYAQAPLYRFLNPGLQQTYIDRAKAAQEAGQKAQDAANTLTQNYVSHLSENKRIQFDAAGNGWTMGNDGKPIMVVKADPTAAGNLKSAESQGSATGTSTAKLKDQLIEKAQTTQNEIANLNVGISSLNRSQEGGIPSGPIAPWRIAASAYANDLGLHIPALGDPEALGNAQVAQKTLAVVAAGILQNALGKGTITEGKIAAYIHSQPDIMTSPQALQKILVWARTQSEFEHNMAMDGLRTVDKNGNIAPDWQAKWITTHGAGPLFDAKSGETKLPDNVPSVGEQPIPVQPKPTPTTPTAPGMIAGPAQIGGKDIPIGHTGKMGGKVMIYQGNGQWKAANGG